MNKLYTLAALALVSGSLSAQRLSVVPSNNHFGAAQRGPVPAFNGGQPAAQQARGGGSGEVVFSEDFANGLAGNNGGVGAWTTSGPDAAIWVYSHTGPNGAYSDNTEAITSTTASNGFMIFQSDSANTNWSNPSNPVIVANPAFLKGSLESPVIDLSATPFVQIEFQERMRYCCSTNDTTSHFLEVSTDGGATWSGRLDAQEGILDNDDPETITCQINISELIAPNPANVKIRFTQDGTENEVSHYHWQIDDIQIRTSPMHDLRITDWNTTSWNLETALTYDSLRYTVLPLSQIRSISPYVTFFNNGQSEETNVVASFTGDDGFDQDVNLGTVAQFATVSVPSPLYTPTTTIGMHHLTFSLAADDADEAPADNVAMDSIAVSEFVYARDNGARTGYTTNTQNSAEPNAAYLLGNMFHVANEATLYGIDVAFATGSTVGTIVSARLTNDAREPLAITLEHELTQADLNASGGSNFVSFIFEEPQFIDAGTDVGVFVEHFGTDVVRTCTSGNSVPQTSHIYDEPTGTWFYTTNTPMVRMNFNETIGIRTNDVVNGVGLGLCFPNPAKDNAVIDYSLVKGSMVTMELHDLSGKLVRVLANGNMAAGTHRVTVNTSDLNEGVYFYTLTAGDTRATKRMTVVH